MTADRHYRIGDYDVVQRRSTRRRRGISARIEGGKILVMLPAALDEEQAWHWTTQMAERVIRKVNRNRGMDLSERAQHLIATYLPGWPSPASVAWTARQNLRWGSCTVTTREIRLSERLIGMPDYVVDSVLLHELVHLVHSGHGRAFKAALDRYPHLARAEAYLAGVSFARGLPADW